MEDKTAYKMHWYVSGRIPQTRPTAAFGMLSSSFPTYISLSQDGGVTAARQSQYLSCSAPKVRNTLLRSAHICGTPWFLGLIPPLVRSPTLALTKRSGYTFILCQFSSLITRIRSQLFPLSIVSTLKILSLHHCFRSIPRKALADKKLAAGQNLHITDRLLSSLSIEQNWQSASPKNQNIIAMGKPVERITMFKVSHTEGRKKILDQYILLKKTAVKVSTIFFRLQGL
jgi:hypothetical protein